MEKQVNYICKSSYYQIWNIGLIPKYINDEACKTLVKAFIISRLDYGSALLYIDISLINHLQQVQNCFAHLATCTHKISVPATLTSCTFQITVQDPVSHFQSTEWNSITVHKWSGSKIYTSQNAESCSLLKVPKIHTSMYGEKSFQAWAPMLWNKLPIYNI